MRQCPTIEGDFRPLIVQSIDACQCFARQRDFYHKCHRCVFRGKSAEFVHVPTARAELTEGVHRHGDPARDVPRDQPRDLPPGVLLPGGAAAEAPAVPPAARGRRRAKITGTS